MPQFINPLQAAALCVRFPHVPITQCAERQGSGKITLNKSGSSGTRIWQCPWFFYPAFCDWLLGRSAVNPFGRPQLHRPDVFSPCYPWLYCQEASVEGEDLLGVDLSLRAFYRRAIVTAKYQPLELNNSIHINSQMLTIPNTQFIFIGQSPTNLAGFQQIFGVEMVGLVNGGTFRLGFANDAAAATFLTPAIGGAGAGGAVASNPLAPTAEVKYTDGIKYSASAAEVRDAVRFALGITGGAKDRPQAVIVNGPEGKPGATGPWIITLNIPEVKTIVCDPASLQFLQAGLTVSTGSNNSALDMKTVAVVTDAATRATATSAVTSADDWWFAQGAGLRAGQELAHASLYRLAWSGRFKAGAFRVKVTFADGTINYGNEVSAASATYLRLAFAIGASMDSKVSAPPGGTTNTNMRNDLGRFDVHAADRGVFSVDQNYYISFLFRDGARIDPNGDKYDGYYKETLSAMATDDPYRPFYIYFGFHSMKSRITDISLVWSGAGTGGEAKSEPPTLKLTKYDPYLANRLDQNVGKVVPMGEITMQRHQVIASDMNYLLAVVGSVNMFTFQGFPPWTLLLSGIEAKQTRLPNGQPCFDMTFKFAYNPYTHQAIFRPLYMRWEFVRGVMVARLPSSVMVPKNPLNPLNSRAAINPKAVARAWVNPNVPRVIPIVIDPRSGKVVAGGAAGVAAGAVGAVGGGGGAIVAAGNDDFGGGGDFGGMLLGGGLGNANPNTVQAAPQNGNVVGQVQPPYGQVPASQVEGNTRAVVNNVSQPLVADPNSPAHAPDAWESMSNILGDMIARSIGVGGGQANEDQEAAASGIEEDIKLGREQGADWINVYDNGVAISAATGGTGNMEYDLALARTAHECGADLAPCTREFLGLPADPGSKIGADRDGLGFDPGTLLTDAITDAAKAVNNAAKAVNVGAAKSVQQMSTRIYDLGLIYPICDMSPILWMQ